MIVTIHQPEHLPWPGFFHKMKIADKYIILDTVQFTKNNVQNRNKVCCLNKDFSWISVPIGLKKHTSNTFAEIKISNTKNPKWKKKYWAKIENNYKKHPFFKHYQNELQEIICGENEYLLDLNMKLISFFRRELKIKTPILLASSLKAKGKKSELLLNLCLKMQASTYLSGPSGKDYLKTDLFEKTHIEISYHHFHYPKYHAPKYVPYLSTLDLLMNHGPESMKIIMDANE